ncbi:hypothetical protein J3Q64DRAFT_1775239 [Phycomyces blakesleeanus]|uniref:Uncharacterized protein n=1 Tax=Phycomyces blakesleeanus TaxID=4837 RepID=A0ABR3AIL5_PHYBL
MTDKSSVGESRTARKSIDISSNVEFLFGRKVQPTSPFGNVTKNDKQPAKISFGSGFKFTAPLKPTAPANLWTTDNQSPIMSSGPSFKFAVPENFTPTANVSSTDSQPAKMSYGPLFNFSNLAKSTPPPQPPINTLSTGDKQASTLFEPKFSFGSKTQNKPPTNVSSTATPSTSTKSKSTALTFNTSALSLTETDKKFLHSAGITPNTTYQKEKKTPLLSTTITETNQPISKVSIPCVPAVNKLNNQKEANLLGISAEKESTTSVSLIQKKTGQTDSAFYPSETAVNKNAAKKALVGCTHTGRQNEASDLVENTSSTQTPTTSSKLVQTHELMTHQKHVAKTESPSKEKCQTTATSSKDICPVESKPLKGDLSTAEPSSTLPTEKDKNTLIKGSLKEEYQLSLTSEFSKETKQTPVTTHRSPKETCLQDDLDKGIESKECSPQKDIMLTKEHEPKEIWEMQMSMVREAMEKLSRRQDQTTKSMDFFNPCQEMPSSVSRIDTFLEHTQQVCMSAQNKREQIQNLSIAASTTLKHIANCVEDKMTELEVVVPNTDDPEEYIEQIENLDYFESPLKSILPILETNIRLVDFKREALQKLVDQKKPIIQVAKRNLFL